jgi:hypothetical protein
MGALLTWWQPVGSQNAYCWHSTWPQTDKHNWVNGDRDGKEESMNARNIWSHILIIVGSIAMLVGAVDPMEGSLVILPGSGLVALGTFLGQNERRLIAYRVGAFILIAMGVGALWGLSMVGGFGGNSGRSNWWAVLILPYLIGWLMGIWGPGSPRWLLLLGIVVGLWYLAIGTRLMNGLGIVFATIGVLTIGGCITALVRRLPAKFDSSRSKSDTCDGPP